MNKCKFCGKDGLEKQGLREHEKYCRIVHRYADIAKEELETGLLLCETGCGLPARFTLKVGKVCCSEFVQSCPETKRKNSLSKSGEYNPRGMLGKKTGRLGRKNVDVFGVVMAGQISKKISNRLTGKVTGMASTVGNEIERVRKISDAAKKNTYGNYGGYKRGAGRGRHGWYKCIWFDSSWELAWIIFNIDHGIQFDRNSDRFEYQWDGKTHKYLPDFKMADGKYVEVKSWLNDKVVAKLKACPGVLVLMKKEMEPFIQYAIGKYGKDFVEDFEIKRKNVRTG